MPELWHYQGPSGQKQGDTNTVVEWVLAAPRAHHQLWRADWESWRLWSTVDEVVKRVRAAAPVAPPLSPDRKPSRRFTVSRVGFEMIRIEAGSFLMGSPEDDAEAYSDEKPQHTVRLSRAFQLGKVPVTQELWQAVMGSNPSKFKNGSAFACLMLRS